MIQLARGCSALRRIQSRLSTDRMAILHLFFYLLLVSGNAAEKASGSSWMTLSGDQPLVVARGGQAGILPDQTIAAYVEALNKTAGGNALYCDLQLSKDGQGICRTDLDLTKSTNISDVVNVTGSTSSYNVNGRTISGLFSMDFSLAQLLTIGATQPNGARPSTFDGFFPIFTPENLTGLLEGYTQATDLQGTTWFNVEYAKFYEDHKINVTDYVVSAMKNLEPGYISSPEVGFLRQLRASAGKTKTITVFKIPNDTAVEPTTNLEYTALLKNLKDISSFASGILVSKELIWPVDPSTSRLRQPTSLVKDAHAEKLKVFAYNFANDAYPTSYNYSFDPIKEQLQFIKSPGFAVDGVLTDFPTTASLAVECYASGKSVKQETVVKPFAETQVVSHAGGDSGNYPGSTRLSLQSAIDKGADYIDCPVQITKDGVTICRESPDLLLSTDVSKSPLMNQQRQVAFIENPGVFTFDFRWNEIEVLKATMNSPQKESSVYRNRAYDGQEEILKLSDFLDIAKSSEGGAGIYLVLQKAYLLNATLGLDTVAAVVAVLKKEGLDKSTKVVIQSEDAAVLRALQRQVSATLIYQVPQNGSVTLTDSVLKEIRQMASGVAVPRTFISPVSDGGFLSYPTDVVDKFHAHNLSVLVVFFRNEFTSIAFDFMADPTIELHSFVQYHGIDGVVTDFPGTARSYLTSPCRQPSSSRSFNIPVIRPGVFATNQGLPLPPEAAPGPPLSTAEPALVPPLAPAPAPARNSATAAAAAAAAAVQVLLVAAVAAATCHHLQW